MKKILISVIVICGFLTSLAYAEQVTSQKLRADKALMDSYAFTNATVVTSDSIAMKGNLGFATLIVDFDASGGDLDIDIELSQDNVIFYTPYTTDGATLTEVGGVADAVTVDRWIILNSRLANYARFEFDPDSTCTVDSIRMIYLEDN